MYAAANSHVDDHYLCYNRCHNRVYRPLFYDESIIHMRNIIKQLRKEAGFRQEDMAKELGVSRQTIIAIENDKYNPTLELAMKIARLLERHVEDIFFLND